MVKKKADRKRGMAVDVDDADDEAAPAKKRKKSKQSSKNSSTKTVIESTGSNTRTIITTTKSRLSLSSEMQKLEESREKFEEEMKMRRAENEKERKALEKERRLLERNDDPLAEKQSSAEERNSAENFDLAENYELPELDEMLTQVEDHFNLREQSQDDLNNFTIKLIGFSHKQLADNYLGTRKQRRRNNLYVQATAFRRDRAKATTHRDLHSCVYREIATS